MRAVIMVSSLTFNDPLCMVDEPFHGLYLQCDTLSAAWIVQALTQEATIECTGLNSDISPLHTLQRITQISDEEASNDRYTFGGLFDVMVHTGRAIIATSHLYATYCNDNPHLDLQPEPLQDPAIIYSRVVTGLAHTFFYPDTLMEQVVGSLQDCQMETLKSKRWFPNMKWVPRAQKGSSVTLWRSALRNAIDVDQKVATSTSPSTPRSSQLSKPLSDIPRVARTYEEDVDEPPHREHTLDSDEDGECSTDDEYYLAEARNQPQCTAPPPALSPPAPRKRRRVSSVSRSEGSQESVEGDGVPLRKRPRLAAHKESSQSDCSSPLTEP